MLNAEFQILNCFRRPRSTAFQEDSMNRRTWLQGLVATAGSALASHVGAAAGVQSKEIDALQKNWRTLLAQGAASPSPAEKVSLSKDEWRKRLEKMQYYV